MRCSAELQSRLGPAGVENVYVLAPRGRTLFVVGDPTGDDPPFTVQDTVYVELKIRVLASGVAESTPSPYTDEYGTWISGYAPIRGGGDGVVAILGADLPLGAFPLASSIVARTLAFSLLPALLLAALASILFSRRLTRPVQKITAGLRRVQQGNLDTELTITSRDEFGDIAEAFNQMTEGLAEKARLRDMFAQSVSAEVVEQLLSGEIDTGGELREVTVLFERSPEDGLPGFELSVDDTGLGNLRLFLATSTSWDEGDKNVLSVLEVALPTDSRSAPFGGGNGEVRFSALLEPRGRDRLHQRHRLRR